MIWGKTPVAYKVPDLLNFPLIEISGMAYDNNEAAKAMPALMHNIGEFEYQREWARCWVDLGTTDAMALDILINALGQVDDSVVQLNQVCVGGVNADWPIDEHPDALFQKGN